MNEKILISVNTKPRYIYATARPRMKHFGTFRRNTLSVEISM